MIDQTAETLSSQIRKVADECRKAVGVPCQSEYAWHAETYSEWADAVSLLEQERDEARQGEAYELRQREKSDEERDSALVTLARMTQRVEQWRTWAQFVYLDGGTPQYADEVLQKRVCEAHDKDTAEHQARADASTSVLTALQQGVERTIEALQCAARNPTLAGVMRPRDWADTLSTLLDQVIPRQEEQTEAHP